MEYSDPLHHSYLSLFSLQNHHPLLSYFSALLNICRKPRLCSLVKSLPSIKSLQRFLIKQLNGHKDYHRTCLSIHILLLITTNEPIHDSLFGSTNIKQIWTLVHSMLSMSTSPTTHFTLSVISLMEGMLNSGNNIPATNTLGFEFIDSIMSSLTSVSNSIHPYRFMCAIIASSQQHPQCHHYSSIISQMLAKYKLVSMSVNAIVDGLRQGFSLHVTHTSANLIPLDLMECERKREDFMVTVEFLKAAFIFLFSNSYSLSNNNTSNSNSTSPPSLSSAYSSLQHDALKLVEAIFWILPEGVGLLHDIHLHEQDMLSLLAVLETVCTTRRLDLTPLLKKFDMKQVVECLNNSLNSGEKNKEEEDYQEFALSIWSREVCLVAVSISSKLGCLNDHDAKVR